MAETAKLFQGTWTNVKESGVGYDEYMDALDLADKKDLYRDLKTTIEYTIEGDIWKAKVTTDKFPGEHLYEMPIGKPFKTAALSGEPVEAIFNITGDNKVTEKYKVTIKGKDYDSVTERVVNGDEMELTSTTAGKKFVYKMKRVK